LSPKALYNAKCHLLVIEIEKINITFENGKMSNGRIKKKEILHHVLMLTIAYNLGRLNIFFPEQLAG
jgi:hypothetical protein